MYVPLHGHSTFSFLEAIGKPKDIIKKAKELWFHAIALTDLNVIYWLIQFYQAANAEGIKPLLWVEVGFVMNVKNILNTKNVGSFCLLAKSDQWYLNLLKLITFASQEWVERRPKIDLNALEENKEGLLCYAWGPDSWIASMLANSESLWKINEIQEMIEKTLGKENCFFEIIAQDEKKNPNIKEINSVMIELWKSRGIPCFVSNVYLYPSQKDKVTHELAMAIKDNVTIYDSRHRVLTTENHLMVEDEIKSICKMNWYADEQVNSWIEQTEKIANLCDAHIEMWQKLFPKYEVEADVAEIYEKYKNDLIVED